MTFDLYSIERSSQTRGKRIIVPVVRRLKRLGASRTNAGSITNVPGCALKEVVAFTIHQLATES